MPAFSQYLKGKKSHKSLVRQKKQLYKQPQIVIIESKKEVKNKKAKMSV